MSRTTLPTSALAVVTTLGAGFLAACDNRKAPAEILTPPAEHLVRVYVDKGGEAHAVISDGLNEMTADRGDLTRELKTTLAPATCEQDYTQQWCAQQRQTYQTALARLPE